MDLSKMSIEDLKDSYKEYAQVIGLDNFIKLSKLAGGTQIYVPLLDEVIKNYKYKLVISEYKEGASVKSLAIKYHMGEKKVYELVREVNTKGKSVRMKGQLKLSDCL